MRTGTPASLAALLAPGLLAGCATSPEPDLGGDAVVPGAAVGDRVDDATSPPSAPVPSAPGTGPAPGTSGDAADRSTLRDGTWQVGDAGEVELSAAVGALQLLDARAQAGWMVSEREIEPDDLEIDFRDGPVAYTFEVELGDGTMTIDIRIDYEITGPLLD